MSVCWDDDERDESIVTDVRESGDWWDIRHGVYGFGLEKVHGVTPKVGDTLVTWGSFGRPIRGVALNGVVAYYRTPAEQEVEDKKQIEKWRAEKIAKYESHRADYDTRVAALPAPLRERLEGFRAFGGDNWRWEYEPYELASCEEAARMVQHFKDADEIRFFAKMDYDQQKTAYPQADGGHSGNTWGMALLLAALMYESPASVPKYHAAICALVGCQDAGCYSVRGVGDAGAPQEEQT